MRDSLDEVRRIARELRPEALDDLGLVNALIALCHAHRTAQGGPRVDRDLQGELPPLSPDVELVIYRVAQEGLTNALRHAGARSVKRVAHGRRGVGDARGHGRRQGHADAAARGHGRDRGDARAGAACGRALSIESSPEQGTEVRLDDPDRQEDA